MASYKSLYHPFHSDGFLSLGIKYKIKQITERKASRESTIPVIFQNKFPFGSKNLRKIREWRNMSRTHSWNNLMEELKNIALTANVTIFPPKLMIQSNFIFLRSFPSKKRHVKGSKSKLSVMRITMM